MELLLIVTFVVVVVFCCFGNCIPLIISSIESSSSSATGVVSSTTFSFFVVVLFNFKPGIPLSKLLSSSSSSETSVAMFCCGFFSSCFFGGVDLIFVAMKSKSSLSVSSSVEAFGAFCGEMWKLKSESDSYAVLFDDGPGFFESLFVWTLFEADSNFGDGFDVVFFISLRRLAMSSFESSESKTGIFAGDG